MVRGRYFAPDFRGGANNKTSACMISFKTEESTLPSISIQAVALTCTHALQHKRPLTNLSMAGMTGHSGNVLLVLRIYSSLASQGREERVCRASCIIFASSVLLNLDRLQVFTHCGSHLPTSTSLGSKEVLVSVCITAILLEKTWIVGILMV